RRAQLARDVLQPEDRARLHSEDRAVGALQRREERAHRLAIAEVQLRRRGRHRFREQHPERHRCERSHCLGSREEEEGLEMAPGRLLESWYDGNGRRLVFQGRANGNFEAYDAKSGKKLWSMFLGSGISAPPITYEVEGKQYVSILVGWGGAGVGAGGGSASAKFGWAYRGQTRRLFTFWLAGRAKVPALEPPVFPEPLVPADFTVDDKLAEKGRGVYIAHCLLCHGSGAVAGGATPDLRASPILLDPSAMKAVVRGGAR